MSFYLCGETGIVNRGCEAIIRSTLQVLNQRSGDVYLTTFAPDMDRPLAKELGINLLSYGTYPTRYHRYVAMLLRKIFRYSIEANFVQAQLFYHLKSTDVCLNIGGDTYCYGRPTHSISLNKYTHKRGINNILWCCSVEDDVMQGEILEDLKKYRYIFAREQITYKNLIKAGVEQEKVIKCCDPAFFLDAEIIDLPKGFVVGNTVGINLSEMVIKSKESEAYKSVIKIIEYILHETDMSICLISHVYNIETNICDWPILYEIFQKFNHERLTIVDKELNCQQLKWIISNCRFMIAARTHASIAAYSSEIPTIVLGYSIKSKGIAMDLFGTTDNYVIPFEELNEENFLKGFNYIVENEEEIRNRLHDFLPVYRESLLSNIHLLTELSDDSWKICDSNLCTGCMACRDKCPKGCIKERTDDYGFTYPVIEKEICVSCNVCKTVCPVANKVKEQQKTPQCYSVYNQDEQIRYNSSSGGVFYSIAAAIINSGGIVFGAAFDDSFMVVQKMCETMESLAELQGSKYVQSDVKNTYGEVECALNEGRLVLYSGTPCQIGGLKAYLKNDYENLITIDIICHGVPSPLAWKQYITYWENKEKSKIKSVSFRDKSSGWKVYSIVLNFENGNIRNELVTDNLFMQGFISHLDIRPSCYECSFKQKNRISDLTLGDFWGINQLEEIDDNKGVSVVFAHTEKGKRLLKKVQDVLCIKSIDFKRAISENSSYLKSAEPSPYKKRFENEWKQSTYEKAAYKYCTQKGLWPLWRKVMCLFYWKWKE